MRSRFEGVPERAIAEAVARGWGVSITELRYLPVGAGAYHWIAEGADGRRWFATCDDLDTKPWLGHERDTVFHNLLIAYGTAVELRRSGLEFIAAPTPSRRGPLAARVDARHCVSVLEHLDGDAGSWGRSLQPRGRDELVTTLSRLHRSTPTATGLLRRGLDVPGRDELERALDDLDGSWDGGPLSELAQRQLEAHAGEIADALADLDRVAREVDSNGVATVVTHGEPHPGNVIHHRAGSVLIDWDTVALAPPERDLWMMCAADDRTFEAYRRHTGTVLDRDLLKAYRRLWALADIASFTAHLRGCHQRNADAHRALAALRSLLEGHEPSPYGPARAWT